VGQQLELLLPFVHLLVVFSLHWKKLHLGTIILSLVASRILFFSLKFEGASRAPVKIEQCETDNHPISGCDVHHKTLNPDS
jgi:hypothetical protein